jgi:hypothetical protein
MNDKEIRIDGLSVEQVQMLDMMWAIESYQDYQDWIDNLTPEDAVMAQELQNLLMIEMFEHELDDDVGIAKEYLKKFQL